MKEGLCDGVFGKFVKNFFQRFFVFVMLEENIQVFETEICFILEENAFLNAT